MQAAFACRWNPTKPVVVLTIMIKMALILLFRWALLITAATTADAADPACSKGVLSGLACCSSSCGTCGGPGCSGRK